VNIMIMIMIASGWNTSGNIFKYFGILINDPFDI
jgi:hypothetical protein